MQSLKDAFQLQDTQETVLTVAKETNERAETDIMKWKKNKHSGKSYQWKKTDYDDIWALIGLLIVPGGV